MMYAKRITFLLALALFTVAAQGQSSPPNSKKEVFLNVSVWNKEYKFLKDLSAENFEVLVDKTPQKITSFKKWTDAPLSVGIVVDFTSTAESWDSFPGASDRGIPKFGSSIATGLGSFLSKSNPNNEYFVLDLVADPILILPLTDDSAEVERVCATLGENRVKGTPVFEGLESGFAEHKNSTKKRVIVLVTSGDGGFWTKFDDIRKLARSQGTPVYVVKILRATRMSSLAEARLKEIASYSGGIVFETNSPISVNQAFDLLAEELKSQYVIGFEPAVKANKDNWYETKVRVNLSPELERKTGKASFNARSGFSL